MLNFRNIVAKWTSQTVKRSFSVSVSQRASQKNKICIVGAGPAGFYAAQHILKNLPETQVDVVEKLPVPYGLVRFGVAPDHPEVKNVINTFSKTAENPNLRFFGNVSLGKDVTLKQLQENYHAVLLAYGADEDRKLNIPNENKDTVLSAREFVAWYNGLPGAENLNPNLDCENVAIIGQGNVAIDVARILLSPLDTLRTTDITEFALETLAKSQVRNVYLVGRRGPLQAAFTIKELREMLKLSGVATLWRPEDFHGVKEQIASLQRPRKRITELMWSSLELQNSSSKFARKQFLPIFLRSPKEIKSGSLELTINVLKDNTAVATDNFEHIRAELILRSIGYKSICVDEAIDFDEKAGLVCNEFGRVKDKSTGTMRKGLYVTGWLGTGPTGVILTTMNNSFGVAKTICDDFKGNHISTKEPKPGLNFEGMRVVTWEGWKKIDEAEVEMGKKKGKPREKIVSVEKMLEIAT